VIIIRTVTSGEPNVPLFAEGSPRGPIRYVSGVGAEKLVESVAPRRHHLDERCRFVQKASADVSVFAKIADMRHKMVLVDAPRFCLL
jgi:hypothetical protein